jgi:hypothetical protein
MEYSTACTQVVLQSGNSEYNRDHPILKTDIYVIYQKVNCEAVMEHADKTYNWKVKVSLASILLCE